jgi:hypothetical protein
MALRGGRYRLVTRAALIGAVTGLALWRAREPSTSGRLADFAHTR